jgi:hypothetical protein
MSQQPVYQGGDQTNDPVMGINLSPAYPPNNTIAFFTGTDDSLYTRRIARWLNLDYITMKRRDYDTMSTLSDRYTEPWDGRIYIEGTDGMVFHPNVQPGERISALVPDFVRVAYFVYDSSDFDTYNGLELMNWQIDPLLMLNQTVNQENKRYHTEISGTANLRVALQAPILATKGHYF